MDKTLPWDGSHLGKFNSEAIISSWDYQKKHFFVLNIHDIIIHCVALQSSDIFPCLVDEMKEIFGVAKTGTHRIKLDNKGYILFRAIVNDSGDIVDDVSLSKLDDDHFLRGDFSFRREVRKVLLFRDILAITGQGELPVAIRLDNSKYFPISYVERQTFLLKDQIYNSTMITSSLYNKWFTDETQNSTLSGMIKLRRKENELITKRLSEIRGKLDDVIRRVDKKYIWYGCSIMERIMRLIDT